VNLNSGSKQLSNNFSRFIGNLDSLYVVVLLPLVGVQTNDVLVQGRAPCAGVSQVCERFDHNHSVVDLQRAACIECDDVRVYTPCRGRSCASVLSSRDLSSN
jgi:hypothetical protein